MFKPSLGLSSVIQLYLTLCTPWTAARQASLSITNSKSLLKLMFIELVMPSNHLILCCPFLLLSSVFPSIRVFFNESVLHIRWPKYCSFSFSISPSNEYSRLIAFRIDWFDPWACFLSIMIELDLLGDSSESQYRQMLLQVQTMTLFTLCSGVNICTMESLTSSTVCLQPNI